MVVKTFRGQLADGGQDRIRLQTIKGKVGYRITKLDVVTAAPGTANLEHVVKIFKESQTTIDALINFTDSSLLASAICTNYTAAYQLGWHQHIIFDKEIFNQDIYISHKDAVGNAQPCNYYIELEVIPLDDAGAEYTTLKDMRQV